MRRLLHLTFLCFLLGTLPVSAADFYWRALGFGAWNNANNWSATPAGPVGVGVPGASDVAIFSPIANGFVQFDLAVTTVQKIQIDNNYNGTFFVTTPLNLTGAADGLGFEMQSASSTFLISPVGGIFNCTAGFSMVRGVFNLANPGNHNIGGNFTLNGPGNPTTGNPIRPDFNIVNGVNLTFGGNFTLANPSSFGTADNSTVIFAKQANGVANINIAASPFVNASFYDLVFNEDLNATDDNRANLVGTTNVIVRNLLNIQSGRLVSGAGTGKFTLLGNIQTSGNMVTVGAGGQSNAILEFAGSTDQTINFVGADEDKWNGPIIFNKPAGNTTTITLLAPLLLNGGTIAANQTVTFTNGPLITTSANRLIFGPLAVAAGANVNSYVDGPVEKRATANSVGFTFPIGKGGIFAPAHLSGNAGFGSNMPSTANFLAEYFHVNPDPTYDTDAQSTANPVVHEVSQTEYWSIDQISGATSTPRLWLSYESLRSGGITDPSTLGVSGWESPGWWALFGQSGFATLDGSTYVGSFAINTFNQINYDPVFTLSTIDPIANPLPVNWLSFTGRYFDGAVDLTWSTALELNNESYTIERSADGHSYSAIGTVAGRGTTNSTSNYTFKDLQPLTGAAHYRIKQSDLDGKFSYSKAIRVSSSEAVLTTLRLYPNPVVATSPLTMENTNWRNKKVSVIVYNAIGSIVYQQQITFGADSRAKLNLSGLKKGNYFISSYLDGEKQTLPFIVQ